MWMTTNGTQFLRKKLRKQQNEKMKIYLMSICIEKPRHFLVFCFHITMRFGYKSALGRNEIVNNCNSEL